MIDLLCGDCLDLMADIADGSVDLVLCDLPYGTTQCRWDQVIPFEPLWAHYKRIIKRNGAIVLTACQPFTSALVMSNPKWFRYEWVWNKRRAGNFFSANREPLRVHESVLVFAGKATVYNPQMAVGTPYQIKRRNHGSQTGAYGKQARTETQNHGTRHPTTCLEFGTPANSNKLHPTQKPVALMEYLIRTYTNEGELVLDNTMGSGTTMVACLNTNRRGIGIEKDPGIFATAQARVAAAQRERESLLIPA